MEILNKIRKELNVPKKRYNSFGKYKFRSCEDILEGIKNVTPYNNIFLSDEIVLIGERYYVKAEAKYVCSDGKEIAAYGYAREDNDVKGMSSSQVTGSASSYARKYALNALLLIDDLDDADTRKKPVEKANFGNSGLIILEKDSANFEKCKKALKSGFSIDNLKAKYEISKDVEKELLK